MNDEVARELIKAQTATMMAVVTVAARVIEGLVSRGSASVDDGRAILGAIVEELRHDGDSDDGRTKTVGYIIADEIEKRAFALRS